MRKQTGTREKDLLLATQLHTLNTLSLSFAVLLSSDEARKTQHHHYGSYTKERKMYYLIN